MYTVSHFYYDEFGTLRSRRWNMRSYKNESVAQGKADSVKGGFTCRLGSNNIHKMGEWAL